MIAVHQFPKPYDEEKVKKKTFSPLDFFQRIERQWHPLFIYATCVNAKLYTLQYRIGQYSTFFLNK